MLEGLQSSLDAGRLTSPLRVDDFFPRTFRLDIVPDLVRFLNATKDEPYWLFKKSASNQGKGIQLVADVERFKDELLTRKEESLGSTGTLLQNMQAIGIGQQEAPEKTSAPAGEPEKTPEEEEKVAPEHATVKGRKVTNLNAFVREHRSALIQKYIENPLLVEKRKFDVRAFMLVASTQPFLVLYNSGYARLSLNEFTLANFEEAGEKITHLTNNAV